MNESPVTISQVAECAGVSVGTVSRVLNQASNVALENQEKVQRAIEELGYKKKTFSGPSASRRNGATPRSGNIGLIFADAGTEWISHPLNMAYTSGVESACEENGYHSLVEFAPADGSVPRCVREGKVDGVLIKVARQVPDFIKDIPPDMPMVLVGLNAPWVDLPQVSLDNYGAGWMVTKYLWERGHRRIGFLCSKGSHPLFVERMQGSIAFLRSRQAYTPDLVVAESSAQEISAQFLSEPQTSPPDMTEAFDQLMTQASKSPPTALVMANDWMARGMYDVLARRGLRVPQDISVVGFDNVALLCSSMSPQLTSFDLNFGAVVRAAALDLFDVIKAPHTKRDLSIRLVRGHLVERDSVSDVAAFG